MGRKNKDNQNNRPASAPMLFPETKRGIVAIVLFLAAVVIMLAFGGLGGKGGEYASLFFHDVLGRGFLLVPLSLILASVSIFTSIHERFYAPTIIGSVLFLVSFEGVLHLFFPHDMGGGYVGYAAAQPIVSLLDFWPTLVILVGLLVISLVVAFNLPLRVIVMSGRKRDQKEDFADEPVNMEEERKKEAKAAEVKKTEEDPQKEDRESLPAKADDAPMFEIKGLAEEDEKSLHVKKKVRASKPEGAYVAPPLDLLEAETGEPSTSDIKTTAMVIKRALATFGIEVEMGEVNIGPTVTQYTLRPASGVKLARITALQNDLSLALAAHPLRIEAPIPGRSLVGIEIPNTSIMLVRLRNLVEKDEFRKKSAVGLAMVLGRDVAGDPVYAALDRMPHMLIAGATGSGKSICIHSVLMALLYQNAPSNLRLILIDPKRVELSSYADIPHLLTPVITEPQKMVHALRWAVREMEYRYEKLSGAGARDIAAYNKRCSPEEHLAYVVIVVDELADIMAAFGKEVEGMIVRLAQMARAIGIHLIVSTQRPSVEVITGLIKANITSRIAFQVASQVDSRTILDISGAEKLLGRGDMLYLAPDAHKPRRIQSAFVADKEVEKVCEFIKTHNDIAEMEESVTEAQPAIDITGGGNGGGDLDDDPMADDAEKLVKEYGKASATFLQRYLKIGYARAARILDILESRGVVGPGDGAKPREVFGAPNIPVVEGYKPPKDVEDEFAGDDAGEEIEE
jgi:DNA segregation ATPase FtsK/SpoIIIE, S-DNA-T family